MKKNKVKFGLKNAHYAVATIDTETNTATYESPVKFPGAVSLSLDPQGDSSNFFADDGVYFATAANNGYKGNLEIALVPDQFRVDVLGETTDGNGVMVDNTNAETVQFALLFEFTGDKTGRRHVMYNCTAARPAVASTTRGQSVEVQPETLEITAAPIHCKALDRDMTKAYAEPDSSAYENWFKSVYEPTAAAATTE